MVHLNPAVRDSGVPLYPDFPDIEVHTMIITLRSFFSFEERTNPCLVRDRLKIPDRSALISCYKVGRVLAQ